MDRSDPWTVNNAGVSGSAVGNLTGLRVASHHCGQPDPRLAIGAEAPTPVEGPIMLPIADQTLSKSVDAAKRKQSGAGPSSPRRR